MMEGDQAKAVLKAGLIKSQLERLDIDLATQVAFSALSINSDQIFKTVQLMAHLQMMRLMEKDKESITDQQREEFEIASHTMLPQTYLDRTNNEEPQ